MRLKLTTSLTVLQPEPLTMSTATSLFAKINGANGTAASDFASSVPVDPATYRPTQHVVSSFALPHDKLVTVFAIFNDSGTETLHETTDIYAHNIAKLRLRCTGHMFHTSHSSALTLRQARRANEAARQKICAAKTAE